MRTVAWILIPALVLVLVGGIMYVPRQDGRLGDTLFFVLLPAIATCWCIAQVLPEPRK